MESDFEPDFLILHANDHAKCFSSLTSSFPSSQSLWFNAWNITMCTPTYHTSDVFSESSEVI